MSSKDFMNAFRIAREPYFPFSPLYTHAHSHTDTHLLEETRKTTLMRGFGGSDAGKTGSRAEISKGGNKTHPPPPTRLARSSTGSVLESQLQICSFSDSCGPTRDQTAKLRPEYFLGNFKHAENTFKNGF